MTTRLLTRVILPVAIVILLIDRLSKWWIVDVLDLRHLNRLEVLPPFLNLRMAWNEGINFGIPLGGPWILVGLSVLISVGLTWWVLRRGSTAMAWGAGFVVGGALGNAFDRIWYAEKAVADFINNACCGFDNPFSYNVADIAIFAGALWIAVKA